MINDEVFQAAKAVDLVELASQYTQLHKVTANEWAGPCPKCGGRDRFRVHPGKGWFCRKCQGEPGAGAHWNDQIDLVMFAEGIRLREAVERLTGGSKLSKEELDKIAAERQRREIEQCRAEEDQLTQARNRLNTGLEWRAYAAHPDRYAQWSQRGIKPEWVDYYGLGFCPAKTWVVGDREITSPSLTIPYWRPVHHTNGQITYTLVDLKHRLLNDNTPAGKYRHHLAGLGNNLFYADILTADRHIGDLLLVEGEIKAMITWQECWVDKLCLTPRLSVVGLPGKNPKPEWIEEFQHPAIQRVFVCLDPDANRDAHQIAEVIGEKARVVRLPGKIDDLIMAGAMGVMKLYNLLEQAWRQ